MQAESIFPIFAAFSSFTQGFLSQFLVSGLVEYGFLLNPDLKRKAEVPLVLLQFFKK